MALSSKYKLIKRVKTPIMFPCLWLKLLCQTQNLQKQNCVWYAIPQSWCLLRKTCLIEAKHTTTYSILTHIWTGIEGIHWRHNGIYITLLTLEYQLWLAYIMSWGRREVPIIVSYPWMQREADAGSNYFLASSTHSNSTKDNLLTLGNSVFKHTGILISAEWVHLDHAYINILNYIRPVCVSVTILPTKI